MSNNIEENIAGLPLTPKAGGNDATAPNPNMTNTTHTSIGQENAPDIMSILRQANIASSLSPKGSEYVKQFQDAINAQDVSGLKWYNLTHPISSAALVLGKNAVIMVFKEAIRTIENVPPTSYAEAAKESLKLKLGSDVNVINFIVVTPQDYERSLVMATYVLNQLTALSNVNIRALTAKSLKSQQLDISTNPTTYNEFNARHNPHGVPARDDLKMTIAFTSPKKNQNTTNVSLFDLANEDRMEIATVSAYVHLAVDRSNSFGGHIRYIPEVHISEIVPVLPFKGLIQVALSAALHTLIDNGYWKTQFSTIGATLPNIGNLTLNPDGSPFRVENHAQVESMIQQYMSQPVLFLDVNFGRAFLPGLDHYAISKFHNFVINEYNEFLGVTLPTNVTPGNLYANEYTGTVQSGSDHIDSRWVDFLNMMIHHSTQRMQCDTLVGHYGVPDEMARNIRAFHPEHTLLYDTHYVALNPDVIRTVQKGIGENLKVSSGHINNGMLDTSQLITAGQNWATGQTVGHYGGPNNSPYASVFTNTQLF